MPKLARSLTKSNKTVAPLLFLFIDGVGVGLPDPARNPLFVAGSKSLGYYQNIKPEVPRGGKIILTDATLGIDGIPQSATGQTSLFTGVNAAAVLGRHLSGFPTPRLKLVLKDSIFSKAKNAGLAVSFANAYRPEFFNQPTDRVSATTSAFQQAGIPLRSFEDLRRGNALSHEFTRSFINSKGYPFDLIGPEEAAAHLLKIFGECDLLLYEFFMTDMVAHTQSMPEALKLLQTLETFLVAVINGIDIESESLLITSDHGNFEDLSTRSHTLNPVATQVWGPARDFFCVDTLDLTGIGPRVLQSLGVQG
ncbi:MAG TPA: peptidase [Acidobacteriota bacterium]|jgi:hypothetical protein